MAERKLVSSGSPFEGQVGFSRAVRVGDRVLVAGTAPIGAEDRDACTQALRCLEIIETALVDAGATLADVVRTRVFITSRDDWEAVANAHGERFRAIRPAATMVVVAGLLDPRWLVEIEAEAIVGAP